MTVYGGVGAHIRYRLVNDAAVAALVGTRIYPDLVPQRSTFPAAMYTQITSERTSLMGADSGTVRSSWQIDSLASTYQGARELASTIRNSLQRFEGWLPVEVLTPAIDERDDDLIETRTGDQVVAREPVASRRIQSIFVDADRDYYEDALSIYRVTTDYTIWYDETGE